MQLHLSPGDGLPIYRQIVNQVKYLLAAGRLGPGEELPPIRTLADQLLINPNTVARAYLELERAGLVTKRQGAGTYASETRSPLKRTERLRLLTERADALLAEARHLEIELGEVIELIRERSKTMQTQEAK
jgi:GntR family transcriptional regulator